MSCNVCLDSDSLDIWVDWTAIIAVAATDYRCLECADCIELGSQYQRTDAQLSEDEDDAEEAEWEEYATCLGCAECRSAYCCGIKQYGGFWDSLFEAHDLAEITMSGECWDTLGAAGKLKLQAMWRKEAGL